MQTTFQDMATQKQPRCSIYSDGKTVQVYCDGLCKPNPGAMYIGVYCADPLIEMARRIEEYGTNNIAECLSAIAALEECKRHQLGGVELLTDSEVVVGWTTGAFKWKSSTAHEHVPTIRELLRDVGGKILWVPTHRNLADKLSRSLLLTAADRKLAEMKSGRDEFSRMRKPALMAAVGDLNWNQITTRVDKEEYQVCAARWMLRGLPVEKAIRKVEVDREIGHNCHRACDD